MIVPHLQMYYMLMFLLFLWTYTTVQISNGYYTAINSQIVFVYFNLYTLIEKVFFVNAHFLHEQMLKNVCPTIMRNSASGHNILVSNIVVTN